MGDTAYGDGTGSSGPAHPVTPVDLAVRWAPPPELARAWEESPALIAVCLGPDHVLAYQNRASREKFGSHGLGRSMFDVYASVMSDRGPVDRVLATGEPVVLAPHKVGTRDVRGDAVSLKYVITAFGAPSGRPTGVVITALDVTAEARAEQAAARSKLLADLTATLIDAPDATTGLQVLAQTLTETIADLAAVLITPEGAQPDPDSPPVPPQVMAVSPQLRRLGPPPQATEHAAFTPWRGAVMSGEPIVAPITEQTLPLLAADGPSREWLLQAQGSSLAVVPLIVAGTMNGVLVLMTAGGRPAYTADDLPFLSDTAARLSAAIAQLAVQQRQREVALRLQRALLPTDPPSFPSLSIAARYLPGSADIEVGGDWWDVRDLGDGSVSLGIGDVAGRGISAAVVMGQARAAMHAASYTHLAPAVVLSMLDQHLHEVASPGRLDREMAPRFATACYGVLSGTRLRLANAGHLPALLRTADGEVRVVVLPPAPPLGLLIGGFTEVELDFHPGDTLLLFTDGLVESRALDLDVGIARLADTLSQVGGAADLEQVADGLLAGMGREAGAASDDLTLLAVRSLGARPGQV